MGLSWRIRRALWSAGFLGGAATAWCGCALLGGIAGAQESGPAFPRPTIVLTGAQPQQAAPGGGPTTSIDPLADPSRQFTAPPQPSSTASASPAPAAASAPASQGQATFSSGSSGGGAVAAESLPQTQQAVASTPSVSSVSGGEATVRGTSDVGDLLGKSLSSGGVQVQRRSPIISEPRIRGYRLGQIVTQADGGYWFPARPDLDTIVSKLDSTLIRNIVVLKGPYSVRYGPGFAFIDVETLASPRYKCFEWHGSSSLGFKTNGAGWSGQQTVYGGASDWGFHASWDALAGNDYRTGAGTRLPTSYNANSFSYAFGLDFDPTTHFEFKAMRVMQRDIELPGVLTDITRLYTDSVTGRFVMEDRDAFDRWTIDAWYNETRFLGDNRGDAKRRQIPVLDNIVTANAIGGNNVNLRLFTESTGENSSIGGRTAMTWGKEQQPQLTIGADFRRLSQVVNEFDTVIPTGIPTRTSGTTNFPIPRANITDPGVFVDTLIPLQTWLKVNAGARADWVGIDLQRPFNQPLLDGNSLAELNQKQDRNFVLGAGYVTGEMQVTNAITATAGFGHSQRAPSISELYGQEIFLALQQNGFSSYKGNSNLRKEMLNQIDFGVRGDFDTVRTGITAFKAWVQDYITFDLTTQAAGSGGAIGLDDYTFRNTRASIIGVESYGEIDLVEWLTAFGTLGYVDGEDETTNSALPGFYPFDSRVGLRLHEASRTPKWSMELSARMVAPQNRVAERLKELRTPGFTVFDFRTYWQVKENLLLTAGVENFGDRFYREHLDLRTGRGVFQPGVNFYFGVRWTY